MEFVQYFEPLDTTRVSYSWQDESPVMGWSLSVWATEGRALL